MTKQTNTIDPEVVEAEKAEPTKEEKQTEALTWRKRAQMRISHGLAKVTKGVKSLVEMSWKEFFYKLILMAVAGAVVVLAINFFIWLYVVANPLFWVLVALMVLNVVGGMLYRMGLISNNA